jgi:predicted RNase H-like HicB family nuclease
MAGPLALRVVGVLRILDVDGPPPNVQQESLSMNLTAVYMKVPEGCVAFVEELPGANTQGSTLEEAREDLREAVGLVIEANRELAEKSVADKEVTREPLAAPSP